MAGRAGLSWERGCRGLKPDDPGLTGFLSTWSALSTGGLGCTAGFVPAGWAGSASRAGGASLVSTRVSGRGARSTEGGVAGEAASGETPCLAGACVRARLPPDGTASSRVGLGGRLLAPPGTREVTPAASFPGSAVGLLAGTKPFLTGAPASPWGAGPIPGLFRAGEGVRRPGGVNLDPESPGENSPGRPWVLSLLETILTPMVLEGGRGPTTGACRRGGDCLPTPAGPPGEDEAGPVLDRPGLVSCRGTAPAPDTGTRATLSSEPWPRPGCLKTTAVPPRRCPVSEVGP